MHKIVSAFGHSADQHFFTRQIVALHATGLVLDDLRSGSCCVDVHGALANDDNSPRQFSNLPRLMS